MYYLLPISIQYIQYMQLWQIAETNACLQLVAPELLAVAPQLVRLFTSIGSKACKVSWYSGTSGEVPSLCIYLHCMLGLLEPLHASIH